MNTFSIIIPVKPGGYVAACEHLKKIMPDDPRYEILLAEGSAPSLQRNLAANEARGEILYFLDDDSLISPENFDECIKCMSNHDAAVVGGPSITPESDNWLQQVLGLALASAFGSGPVFNRYRRSGVTRRTTDKELILCNLAIRRSVFLAFDGFDERLYPNEENEFLHRLFISGHILLHDPLMCVYRSQRKTLGAFVRQIFNYGRGRAQQSLISGSYSIASFIPLMFVVYLFIFLFFIKYLLLLAPLVLYVSATSVCSLYYVFRTGRFSALILIGIYPIMHCVNGVGLLWGFLRGKPQPVHAGEVTISKIKELGKVFTR